MSLLLSIWVLAEGGWEPLFLWLPEHMHASLYSQKLSSKSGRWLVWDMIDSSVDTLDFAFAGEFPEMDF